MSAAESTLETALHRLLKSQAAPPVPEDLARRIVVRTAHLPQFANEEPTKIAPPEGAIPSVRSRPWYRASLPFGAALAASIALALTIRPSSPGVRYDPPVLSSGNAKLTSSGTGTSRSERSANSLQLASADRVSDPIATVPVRHHQETGTSGQNTAIVLAQAVPVEEQVHPAPNLTNWQAATVDEFALEEPAAPPPSVYGPVLEPEPVYNRSGLPPRGASATGLAATLSRAGASSGVDAAP